MVDPPASRPEPARLAARLSELPGSDTLLPALADQRGVHLVGGAVRDLLRPGVPAPVDLDLVVEGDASAVARTLEVRLGGVATVHERFGTATVQVGERTLDLARARTETYARPGALPDVAPGALHDDLRRRDFTIHAMALALEEARRGELTAVPGALEDLAAGRLRVLHERSFQDDSTRLLRLVRYGARLGFDVERGTAALARGAVASGAPDTVTPARLGAELRLLLREKRALDALQAADELGLLAAVIPGAQLDRTLTERALALLPPDGSASTLMLAALVLPCTSEALAPRLEALQFERGPRVAALAAHEALALTARLAGAGPRTSAVAEALADRPVELAALLGALGAAESVRRWLEHGRFVALEIDGEDLLRAGVPAGPALGRALRTTLARKRDGELAGREQELRAALTEARGGRDTDTI